MVLLVLLWFQVSSKRNMALQSVRDVGNNDSSFSCEPTEHKLELQVDAHTSCNAANISLCVNSQC